MNQVNQVIQVNQSSPYKSAYRVEIDGLRAFAVLSVIAFHASPNWITGGFIGVDVFFVISGFLITSHIFENLDKGQFRFTDFFGRRIRRIFPALILVMACSLVFGWFALLADEYAQLGKHVASGATFVTNFILVDESGYFDNAAETKPMLHLWSLAVEEQFYIVWPFVLWLAWRLKFNLLAITILVAAISFYLNLRFAETHPTETFYWPVGRFWELLSGSILAWLLLYKAKSLRTFKLWIEKHLGQIVRSKDSVADSAAVANLLSFFGLLLLAYGVFRINENLTFPSLWALIPVLGAVLVISGGSEAWLNRVFLMNPIAVWFGLISYPLYLWHWPILSFLQIIDGKTPDRDVRIAAVLLSILLAWLTYIFIERPIRFGRNKTLKGVCLIILLSVVGATGFILSKDGLSQRAWVVRQQLISDDLQFKWKTEVAGICKGLDGEPRCAVTRDFPKTVLLGDSHVPPLYSALKNLYEDLDRGIGVVGGEGGCPPLYKVISNNGGVKDIGHCIQNISRTIEFLIQTDEVEEVMLVSRGPLYFSSKGFGSGKDEASYDWQLHFEDEAPSKRRNEEVFELGLRRTLDLLLNANKKVVFVHDVAELGFNPSLCVSDRYYFPRADLKEPCALAQREFVERSMPFREMVARVLKEYPSVRVIDLSAALCDEVQCFGGRNGRLFYKDDDHLNRYGASIVVDKLKDEFIALYD